MSETEMSVRVLPFNGEKNEWDIWESKFLARAGR